MIDPPQRVTWVRYRVLGMLCLLAFILYLDRICISQALPRIKRDLDLSDTALGFVLGAFTLAYGLFEIPTGHWGDRYGSRGVLTRIVLWWSAFTMLTGAATGFVFLLLIRFLFGAGEAGAFPNTARVTARWFPVARRGSAHGAIITSALIGGTLAPVFTEQLIKSLDWRWTFAVLGIPGVLWALVFYLWFHDDPAQHAAVNEAELRLITGTAPPPHEAPSAEQSAPVDAALQDAVTSKTPLTGITPFPADRKPALADADPIDIALPGALHPPVPWRRVLASANIWLLGTIIICGAFTTYMFFTWFPSYLQRARLVDPDDSSQMAALVLGGGALGSLLGGRLNDWLIAATGNRRWTRRGIGLVSFWSSALAMAASIQCDDPWLASACAAWACLGIHVQLVSWWGAVIDISGKHVGALWGLMNMLGMPGSVGSPIFLGLLRDSLAEAGYVGRNQWDPAFYVYAALLLVGGVCWLFVDVTKSAVEPETQATGERVHGHV